MSLNQMILNQQPRNSPSHRKLTKYVTSYHHETSALPKDSPIQLAAIALMWRPKLHENKGILKTFN